MLEHHVRDYISDKLSALGINSDPYGVELTIVFVSVVIGIAIIGHLITHHIIVRTIRNVLHRTNEPLSDAFTKYKVLEKLTLLVPVMVLDLLIPLALGHYTLLSAIADKVLSISILVSFIRLVFALLDALNDVATFKGITRRMPVKSFVQLIKLFTFFVGLVV